MSDHCSHNSTKPATAAVSSCCNPEPVVSSCCGSSEHGDSCHDSSKVDWLFWGSCTALIASILLYFSGDLLPQPEWLSQFAAAETELLGDMWLGILLGVFFVGALNLFPKNLITSTFGETRGLGSILRAASAGIVLDLCNHGLLLIASKLYKSGVRYSQVLAFLIASPWNSLSLTVVMFALLGWQWTLTFIGLSFVIAVVTGLVIERLEDAGKVPVNPFTEQTQNEPKITIKEHVAQIRAGRGIFKTVFVDAFLDSKMIVRWLLFGMLLAALIKTFVSGDFMHTWFGPTIIGLGLTLVAATIIEVCSEGLLPIAADLMSRAAAPGNAFSFLMAGVSTDYTEILVLKETTGSWKIALLLPMITVPQIVIIGVILNSV